MIKTYNRTPKIYSSESRDFQLFGHLFDAAFNSSKTAIDTILNNQGTLNLDYRFVDLMCKTLGFDYKGNYTTKELLYVIKSFKTIISKKGSIQAIKEAISMLLSSQGIKEPYFIINERDEETNKFTNSLKIYLPDNTKNTLLLEELFDYILPAGWLYSIVIKSYKENESEFITDIAINNDERHKKTDGKAGIDEVKLAELNYIKDGEVVNMENIGEVPTDENADIISPVVNLGTVLNSENQIKKYSKNK